MKHTKRTKTFIYSALAMAGLGITAFAGKHAISNAIVTEAQTAQTTEASQETNSYIVQGLPSKTLADKVIALGGEVSREFPIINAISANLTQSQVSLIASLDNVRVQNDRTVKAMGSKSVVINNHIAAQTGASVLHERGITGQGVTVAVIDSGSSLGGEVGEHLKKNGRGVNRNNVKYNMVGKYAVTWDNDDFYGHGTHIQGIIASGLKSEDGYYNGIAPDVNLVSVKAFHKNGKTSYSIILDSLQWVYDNKDSLNIKVLNLSLGAEVQSNYWDDPINQAVMKLWDAGIVVIASAGNNGIDGMGSITVPGNNPYVITVGAATSNGTTYDFSDDRIATFSSIGPTIEGFVKPEVVSWGAGIESKINFNNAKLKPLASETGEDYAVVSGTSQAAAIVTGVAALILQHNGNLSPDDVKCRILSSAQAANDGNTATYSPFEQGYGMVNAYAAFYNNNSGCANVGLDIKQDIAGTAHFQGPTRLDENNEFVIVGSDGEVLREGVNWGDSSILANGSQWGDTSVLANGSQWGDTSVLANGSQWGDTSVLANGSQWGDTSVLANGSQWGDTSVLANSNNWNGNSISADGQ